LRRLNKRMRDALQLVGVEDARRAAMLPFIVESQGGTEIEDDMQGARPTPVSTSIPAIVPQVGPTRSAWETWARRFAVAAGVVVLILYLLSPRESPWANHLALVAPDLRPGGVVPVVVDPMQPNPTVEPPPLCPPSPPPPRTPPCPADEPHKNAGPRSLGRAAATALDRGDKKSAIEACRLAGPGNVFCRELQSLHP